MLSGTYPILSCEEARVFEQGHLAKDEALEWKAMRRAGRGIAEAVLRDFEEIGGLPPTARILVLAGKGNNGGDALLAAAELRAFSLRIEVDVVFAFGERTLRPLAQRAWRELLTADALVRTREAGDLADGYELCLDGVFGYQYRAPLPPEAALLLTKVNALPVRLRAAVDLPSGLDAKEAFQADFSYATGSLKAPLLTLPNAGRLRLIDLGFPVVGQSIKDKVLGAEVLAPLRAFRSSQTDKRTFGHLLVIAGSRWYPGAALMAVSAALRSGVGLITAAVPQSFAAVFAARMPEVMWLGLPETPGGDLSQDGIVLLRTAVSRATAVLIGPGIGRSRDTIGLALQFVRGCPVPMVIDADALHSDLIAAGTGARILTPHAGEYERIQGRIPPAAIVVRKGPLSRIEIGTGGPYRLSLYGGPVLARGGSGDLLAGLLAGLLAQTPEDPSGTADRGLVWHGLAADALARKHGQVAVAATQLLDFLGPVLRHS
ncbi:carbohydrate kinase [Verrucomicrobia bacterium IMCC26134]|nr:carbohydrate kinase [Verrucomicrobia bacterium IMCC26134]